MSKYLVLTRNTVEDSAKKKYDSWELLSFGGGDIMHAAWNPFVGALVCQFKYHKNNVETIPKYDKKGQVADYQMRNVDTWYRLTINDLDAVKTILENFVLNPIEDWNIRHEMGEQKIGNDLDVEVGEQVAVD